MEEKELTPLQALMDLFDNASRKLSNIDKMYLSINFENYGIIKKALEENEELKNKAQAFDLIVSKNIDWTCLKAFDDVELYNFAKSGKIENLTKEEFNLLKEMFEGEQWH